MIQDGKKVFEQRACVGYNEAKAEPLHPYFALLWDSSLPVYDRGLIREKLRA